MKKNFTFLFILISLVFAAATLSYADDWKTYSNSKLGYELRYPANGVIAEAQENIRNNFYLDPLKPIADLTNDPAFANITVNQKSIVKITFPDHYLIILLLDHAPQNTPPPSAQPVAIGKNTFYQQHTWDAGMCHNYDYYTYFLPRDSQYFAFIFLVTTNCDVDVDSAESRYKLNMNPQDFERILSTIQFTSSPQSATINDHSK